ncbi:MAG: fumarylacetoacetate hydrolase family protein, partial [Halalkalicoccus sp.]
EPVAGRAPRCAAPEPEDPPDGSGRPRGEPAGRAPSTPSALGLGADDAGEGPDAGELAAVIGEECKNVSPEEVPDVVRGYTIMNDVDALDQQGRTARKAFDGSGPLGPWIETELDPRGIDMHTEIDGERRQEANTELMLFDPYEVVSYLSERFTFSPGDVIAFGSPANPGTIEPGNEIEITYEGVGTLRNTVAALTDAAP